MTLAFQPPTVSELFEFEPLFTFSLGGIEMRVTFPIVVMFGVTVLMAAFFWYAFRAPKLVPEGAQNVGESAMDFIRNQVVLPVMGPEGMPWTGFLTTMFFWVFFLNMMSIVPGIQFPVTSLIAVPTVLAILAWVLFNAVGIREQGFGPYFKGLLFPPGVPKAIYILLTPIEFISTLLVRPLTLAVRLFANMVAGHMILGVLFVGTAVFFQSGLGKVTFVLPFALATVLTAFEIFVAGMQAFIITILTAVYIAGASHPEH